MKLLERMVTSSCHVGTAGRNVLQAHACQALGYRRL